MAAAGAGAAAAGGGGAAVKPLSVVDSKGFVIAADAKDAQGVKAIADLKGKNPNVLFAIARSKNLNIVVYEAVPDPKQLTRLLPEAAIDVYWLDIDPAYVVETRKRGVKHDRTELIWLEKSMAYGATATPSATGKAGLYDVALVSVPGRNITLSIDPKDNRPKAYITLTDPKTKAKVDCVLERIFVSSTDRWVGPPKIDFIEISGTAIADGAAVCERVIP